MASVDGADRRKYGEYLLENTGPLGAGAYCLAPARLGLLCVVTFPIAPLGQQVREERTSEGDRSTQNNDHTVDEPYHDATRPMGPLKAGCVS